MPFAQDQSPFENNDTTEDEKKSRGNIRHGSERYRHRRHRGADDVQPETERLHDGRAHAVNVEFLDNETDNKKKKSASGLRSRTSHTYVSGLLTNANLIKHGITPKGKSQEETSGTDHSIKVTGEPDLYQPRYDMQVEYNEVKKKLSEMQAANVKAINTFSDLLEKNAS